jgi:hypothetical protein
MTRHKKNLKTLSVHYKNTDLILKMIKKAKISRVRVPLRQVSSLVIREELNYTVNCPYFGQFFNFGVFFLWYKSVCRSSLIALNMGEG